MTATVPRPAGAFEPPRSARTGVLVEFLGLPGCGKSTLRDAVADLLAAPAGPPVLAAPLPDVSPAVPALPRLARKARLGVRAVAAGPRGSTGCLRRVMTLPGAQARDRLPRAVQWAATQGTYAAARRRPGVHLADEGVLQALWSVGLRAEPGPLLDHLARRPERWLRPDLVVLVDAPPELALARLERRSSRHSRVQALAPEARADELATGRALLDRLLAWWAALPLDAPVPVVTVATDDGPKPPPAAVGLAARITRLPVTPRS